MAEKHPIAPHLDRREFQARTQHPATALEQRGGVTQEWSLRSHWREVRSRAEFEASYINPFGTRCYLPPTTGFISHRIPLTLTIQ